MTAPLPPSSKTRAWVCAPGVLKVPFLSAFLPDYDLSALPGSSIEAVLGWGMKPTAEAGRRWAAKHGKPYVALEDGFLRSVGIGESGATSLSLIVDDLGVYYDATRPSRLEHLIQTAPDWSDAAMKARARGLIDRIVASGVSKTNMGGPLAPDLLKPGRRVLIVDQTFGDASIGYGLATEASFSDMLATARRDEPDAQLIVKRHPAVAAGRKQGCIPADQLKGVTLIDNDVRPADLLAAVDAVYVVTSALGFEALLRGLPVRCFGAPFYSGWGLTTDAVQTGRRGAARDLEQIAAAALIAYTRYVDPVTGQRCEAEQALERLIALRDRADRLAGDWAAVGFAPAKRPPVRRLLNSPKGRVRYFWRSSAAVAHARATGGKLIWWAGKETPQIRAAADAFEGPVVRMEDGFIRSRGLGLRLLRRPVRRPGRSGRLLRPDPAQPSGEPDRGGRAVAGSGRARRGASCSGGRGGPVEIQSEGGGRPGALAQGQADSAGRRSGRERPLDHDGLRAGPAHQLRPGEGGAGGSSRRLPDLSQPPGRDGGQPARPAGPCGDGGGRRLGRRSGHRGLPERLRPAGHPDLPDRVRGPDAGQARQRLRPPLLCRMGPDRRPAGV
jgi:hypothetical protein